MCWTLYGQVKTLSPIHSWWLEFTGIWFNWQSWMLEFAGISQLTQSMCWTWLGVAGFLLVYYYFYVLAKYTVIYVKTWHELILANQNCRRSCDSTFAYQIICKVTSGHTIDVQKYGAKWQSFSYVLWILELYIENVQTILLPSMQELGAWFDTYFEGMCCSLP